MGLTFASERMTRREQANRLRAAGASNIIHVGDDCPTWRDVVRITRGGDTIWLIALVMLPASRHKDSMSPTTQVASAMSELIERGAVIVEVHTGRRSDNKRQREAMLEDAIRGLRGGGRRLPAGIIPPGRPRVEFSEEQLERGRAAWFSRDYATDRIAAKHAGMSREMCRRRWGSSGRPWPARRKRKS